MADDSGDLRFDGQVALVTGVAPGGLGIAYARALAARGARIVANDLGVDWRGERVPAGADAAVAELVRSGAEAVAAPGDVATDAESVVRTAVDAFGGVDILVNNAGSGGAFEQRLESHLLGTKRMTDAAWPWLERAEHPRVVNTASNATWGSDGEPSYGTAKAAVIALTRFQARAGRDAGILVNVVLPSAWANSTAGLPDPAIRDFLRTRFPPEHVATFVTFLCSRAATMTGEAFSLGGGYAARVVQAKTRGVVATDATPETWAERIEEVRDLGHLDVPASMWADVRLIAQHLGPEALAEFDTGDVSGLGGM